MIRIFFPELKCLKLGGMPLRKDIVNLKRAQKGFTRMLTGMEQLSYKERLDRLGLPCSAQHCGLKGLFLYYTILCSIKLQNKE
eukprot:g34349.t1